MKYVRMAIANLAYVTLAALGLVLLVSIGIGVLFVWGSPSCDEDSEAVIYARSLSSERLEKLYHDMEKYSQSDKVPPGGFDFISKRAPIPSEFADLRVRKVRPTRGNIMVEGCFDHYVYLDFDGIGIYKATTAKREISLRWGERPPNAGSEVLWSGD